MAETIVPNPREAGVKTAQGYRLVAVRGPHPRKISSSNYVREHILVAEAALGKYLPTGAVVHHVNEIRHDNRPANLVICQDNAYHRLIHRRLEAWRLSGHADWARCQCCHKHDAPENLIVVNRRGGNGRKVRHSPTAYHPECQRAARRKYSEVERARNVGRIPLKPRLTKEERLQRKAQRNKEYRRRRSTGLPTTALAVSAGSNCGI